MAEGERTSLRTDPVGIQIELCAAGEDLTGEGYAISEKDSLYLDAIRSMATREFGKAIKAYSAIAELSPEEKRAAGASKVLAMFRNMKRKEKKPDGTG